MLNNKLSTNSISSDYIISVIYSIRDRNPERIKQSIDSLKRYENNCDIEYIVVDYGSNGSHKDQIANICKEMGVVVLRTVTQGHPWSRSKAFNIGLVRSRAKYVLITDIDMVFSSDVFKACLNNIQEKLKIHCRPLWLPKNGKKENAWLGDYSQLGGLLFMDRQGLVEAGGFNEKIDFWGSEDRELNIRLTNLGYVTKWIDTEVKMYHQWHQGSYGMYNYIPNSIKANQEKEVIKTIFGEIDFNGSNIGQLKKIEDRKILGYINKKKPFIIKVSDSLLQKEIKKVIDISRTEKYIKLDIGSYFLQRTNRSRTNSVVFSGVLVLSKILNRLGYSVTAKRNENISHFFMIKEFISKQGMIDYYINSDWNSIYLLFEHNGSN